MTSFVLYFAGLLLVGASAWAVARPFLGALDAADPSRPTDSPRTPWQRRKEEALAAIRDAEFDFQLGKLSETDYRDLRQRLEQSALEAMNALERGGKRR